MKLAFTGSDRPRAKKAIAHLRRLYGTHRPQDADVMIVVGGDGAMLHALHEYIKLDIPFYGMNLGTLGFLLNDYKPKALPARIKKANRFAIRPLRMTAKNRNGKKFEALAFNEVSLLRQTHNSASIKITINGKERLAELVCDGVLLSTPMGSTAYNSSAGGSIIPLNANVLPLTPISAFRPRRWRGALLTMNTKVKFEVLRAKDRPVSATADSKEVRDVVQVDIQQARDISGTLLFDPDNHLGERILKEQFSF